MQVKLAKLSLYEKTITNFAAVAASASAQLNYVSVNSSAYCGSNVTATCLQAAITANPHQTLSINPGTWSINSTIHMATDQRLIGSGSNAGGTTSSPAGTTLVFPNDAIGIRFSSYHSPTPPPGGGGLQHIVLTSTAGTKTSVGIFLGGNAPGDSACTNSSADYEGCTNGYGSQLLFEDLLISGFGSGVEVGNYAYVDTFRDVTFASNNDAVYVPANLTSSGERMVFNECLFGNNLDSQINDQTGLEWMIDNSSFDQNSTTTPPKGPAITIGVTFAGSPSAAHLYISNSHFEYGSTSGTSLIYSSASLPNINIQNTTFLIGSSAPPTSIIGATSSSTIVTILGGYAYFAGTSSLALISGGSSTKNLKQSVLCTEVSGC